MTTTTRVALRIRFRGTQDLEPERLVPWVRMEASDVVVLDYEGNEVERFAPSQYDYCEIVAHIIVKDSKPVE